MSAAGESASPLAARAAYRLWAPVYDVENAVTALEQAAVQRATPALRERSLLDAGCGTGRRLPTEAAGLRRCVGVDLVPEMLAAGRARGHAAQQLVAGDVTRLPLGSGLFDLIWCRLALGHLAELAPAYAELARTATGAAELVVTDFHPAAAAAGHTRSFRDRSGRRFEVEHYSHSAAAHQAAGGTAGWRLREHTDLTVGPAIRSHYERAGVLDRYQAQLGSPLVLFLRFGR